MAITPDTSGESIKEIRQQLGLSQAALARLLGVSQVTVSKWEADRMTPRDLHATHLSQLTILVRGWAR